MAVGGSSSSSRVAQMQVVAAAAVVEAARANNVTPHTRSHHTVLNVGFPLRTATGKWACVLQPAVTPAAGGVGGSST